MLNILIYVFLLGYSSHDDSYSSDERHATRARRDKGKRTNLKDESSSGSDEDFHPSDEEERPRATRGKRKRKGTQSEDDVSDVGESGSSDESDVSDSGNLIFT